MKKEEGIKKIRKQRRTARSRNKILGHKNRVRLTVFRSNKYIYAQIIDDRIGKTLLTASEREIEGSTPIERAKIVGQKLAEKAHAAKIKSVVFDKGPYKYHGRIKALAQGAREGGLVF